MVYESTVNLIKNSHSSQTFMLQDTRLLLLDNYHIWIRKRNLEVGDYKRFMQSIDFCDSNNQLGNSISKPFFHLLLLLALGLFLFVLPHQFASQVSAHLLHDLAMGLLVPGLLSLTILVCWRIFWKHAYFIPIDVS